MLLRGGRNCDYDEAVVIGALAARVLKLRNRLLVVLSFVVIQFREHPLHDFGFVDQLLVFIEWLCAALYSHAWLYSFIPEYYFIHILLSFASIIAD